MGDNVDQTILGGDIQAEPAQVELSQAEQNIREAWKKSHLLVFDGGGIRGYWSLLVLNKLMGVIADIEERDEGGQYHSFAPLEWPGDVSQVSLTNEELQERHNLNPARRRDSWRVLDKHKRFLPCHYFDYIGGSSTGGLIAIMVGRLRMTVPDCLAEYEKLGEEVFGNPRRWIELNVGLTKRTKYDAKNLKRIYQSVTERRGEKSRKKAAPTFETNTHTCRCFVTTLRAIMDKDGTPTRVEPYLIRSYKCTKPSESPYISRKSTLAIPNRSGSRQEPNGTNGPKRSRTLPINHGDAHDYEIWEVARATTAARYFFDPIEIRDRGREETMRFEDGGLGHTINPTGYGLSDIRTRHGADSVGIVVSVGTARGRLARQKDPFRFKRKAMETVEIGSDPQVTHNSILRNSEESGFEYYRFNPDDTTQDHLLNMPFDEWLPRHSSKGVNSGSTTLAAIRTAFNSWWASDPAVFEDFENCAQYLVEQRRLRLRDTSKWERYAMATAFECKQKHCDRQDRTWTDVFEFEQHLMDKHGLKGAALIAEKTNAANPWQYREVTNNDRQEGSHGNRRIRFK